MVLALEYKMDFDDHNTLLHLHIEDICHIAAVFTVDTDLSSICEYRAKVYHLDASHIIEESINCFFT